MAQQHDEIAFPDLGRNGEILDRARRCYGRWGVGRQG